MKKILALALAAAMSLSLVACGGGKTEAPAPEASTPAPEASTPAPAPEAETVEITLREQATDPVLRLPLGGKAELSGKNPTFVAAEPGLHTLTYDLGGHAREASFFARIPASEYEAFSAESIIMTKTFERNTEDRLLSSDMLPWAAVLIGALLIVEWGYHYRGKR